MLEIFSAFHDITVREEASIKVELSALSSLTAAVTSADRQNVSKQFSVEEKVQNTAAGESRVVFSLTLPLLVSMAAR